jgi:excisionase family DNA binding protein
MNEKSYLTLEQIADILQLSVETVRTYTKRKKNKLPSYRIGREYRVSREDFDKWMAEQKNTDNTDEE